MAVSHGTSVALFWAGIFLTVWGAGSILAGLTDYRHWMSQMYENNQDRKTGLAALADSPNGYRRNVVLMGLFALGLGITLIA